MVDILFIVAISEEFSRELSTPMITRSCVYLVAGLPLENEPFVLVSQVTDNFFKNCNLVNLHAADAMIMQVKPRKHFID